MTRKLRLALEREQRLSRRCLLIGWTLAGVWAVWTLALLINA